MTAEPRPVEEIREIAERYLYDGDNDRPLNDGYLRLAHVADRLAAADRENAELRGEVERLTRRLFPGQGESYANEVERQRVVIDQMATIAKTVTVERDDLRAQLAAAQALRGEVERLTVRIEGQASTIGTLGQVAAEAGRVMEQLNTHGKGIVGHLLDDDDNAGERLRQLLREVSLWALRDGTSWKERAERVESQLAAAQAQLAEARSWLAIVRDWPSCGESTGIASNRCMLPPGHVGAHDCQLVPGSFAYFAALSAAPQPEPDEVTHVVTDASDDPEHADDCPGCTSGTDDHDVRYWNQPPASDEPARCDCGHEWQRHGLEAGGCIECRCDLLAGPTASGGPR